MARLASPSSCGRTATCTSGVFRLVLRCARASSCGGLCSSRSNAACMLCRSCARYSMSNKSLFVHGSTLALSTRRARLDTFACTTTQPQRVNIYLKLMYDACARHFVPNRMGNEIVPETQRRRNLYLNRNAQHVRAHEHTHTGVQLTCFSCRSDFSSEACRSAAITVSSNGNTHSSAFPRSPCLSCPRDVPCKSHRHTR